MFLQQMYDVNTAVVSYVVKDAKTAKFSQAAKFSQTTTNPKRVDVANEAKVAKVSKTPKNVKPKFQRQLKMLRKQRPRRCAF